MERRISIRGVRVRLYSQNTAHGCHYHVRVIDGDSSVLVASNGNPTAITEAYERQVSALKEAKAA